MNSMKLMTGRNVSVSSAFSQHHPCHRRQQPFSTDATASSNETVDIMFTTQFDETVKTTAKVGSTILDVCLDNELEVEGACGGECCCSTCHVYLPKDLFDAVTPPDEDELDMLDLAIAVKDNSRLGCQVKITPAFDGTTIELPKEVVNNLPDE